MRTIPIWRILALLLLLAGLPVVTSVAAPDLAPDPHARAMAQDDDDDDGNRGHGNDEDGVDEDNPGRGRGNRRGGAPVAITGTFEMEVRCDAEEDRTECRFRARERQDGGEVIRVVLPAASVCADILDGEYEVGEVRGDQAILGYASLSGDDELRLDLRGDVRTSGTVTYWVVTTRGLLPAEGPRLECGQAARQALALQVTATVTPPTSTPQPSPTQAVATGSLLVVASSCDDVPENTAGFDWFGECVLHPDPLVFRLAPAGADVEVGRTEETDERGEAVFPSLEPGRYELEVVDTVWCHAKSDRVTAEGEVVIEAGERSTVWTFMCRESAGS